MHAIEKPNTLTTSETLLSAGNEKYLTFRLAAESYGVPVLKVREIIRLPAITPLPQLPEYIRGIINLRGHVIPVVCLRARFEMERVPESTSNCIIVVQAELAGGNARHIGLAVDSVEEVCNIAASDIDPSPDFGCGPVTEYVCGIAKVRGSVKTLLDIEKVVHEIPMETL